MFLLAFFFHIYKASKKVRFLQNSDDNFGKNRFVLDDPVIKYIVNHLYFVGAWKICCHVSIYFIYKFIQ